MLKKLFKYLDNLEKNSKLKSGETFVKSLTRSNFANAYEYKDSIRKNLLSKLPFDISGFIISNHIAVRLSEIKSHQKNQLALPEDPRYDIVSDDTNNMVVIFKSERTWSNKIVTTHRLFNYAEIKGFELEENKAVSTHSGSTLGSQMRCHYMNFNIFLDESRHEGYSIPLIPPSKNAPTLDSPTYKFRKKEGESLVAIFKSIGKINSEISSQLADEVRSRTVTNCHACNANLVGVTTKFCPYCRAGIH